MLDRMSASHRPIRRSARALLGLLLVVLVAACSTSATTPQPRATIAFLVRNATHTAATYRFTGSATVADVTGPLDTCKETTIGATWDPTWTFAISGGKKATGPGHRRGVKGARNGLTVIVIIDTSGVRTSDVHPGAPDAGDTDAPSPCG